MADAAFLTDWKYVSDHLFGQGANALVSGTTGRLSVLSSTILEEAKRIYRLCLHKKVTISANPQHERCFCIFCALSVKQPNVWATVVQRMAERRMSTCRIPHAGEFNVNEVKRFIRVASAALNLEIAVPVQATAVPSTDKVGRRKDVEHHVVVISAVDATNIVSDVMSTTAQKKNGTAKAMTVASKRQSANEESDAEEENIASYASSKVIRTRDWEDITRRVSELQSRFPCWRRATLGLTETETLLGSEWFATPALVHSNTDGSPSCSVCGKVLPSSSPQPQSAVNACPHTSASQNAQGAYRCVACQNYVHHMCVWPPQQAVPSPFICHHCRLATPAAGDGDSFFKVGLGIHVARLTTTSEMRK